MADKKITQLNELRGVDVATGDLVAVADVSANETRKVTVPELVEAGIRTLPENSIDGSKIINESIDGTKIEKHSITGGPDGHIAIDTISQDNIGGGAIGPSELQDGSVYTDAIQDKAVTTQKIADGAVSTGQIDDESITAEKLAPGSVGTDELQDFSVTAEKLAGDVADRGLDTTTGKIGITNSVGAGTQAGITWNDQGLITGSDDPIPPADLPVATRTEIGAVSVPADGGLAVTGTGAISIENNIAPGTGAKITVDSHGLVTNYGQLDPADLPLATSTTPGAVIVPAVDADGDTALDIAPDGSLTHAETGAAGTYPKVIVNKYGHVVGGGPLSADDIPDLSFDQITSGEIGTGVLGDCAVEGPNICDYATCLMQEDHPGPGDFLGQFWFTPSTAQLRVYARGSGPENIWLPVGFGALQANNLRWLGTYDAATDTIVSLTNIGTSAGLSAGDPFPAPTDALSGGYFLCQIPGNNCSQPNLDGISHDSGDWALCIDETQGWIHIDASAPGGGGGGGAQYLNDLLDVTIGGTTGPFDTAPAMTLAGNQIFKYDGGAGQWRNTDRIDGGDF